MKNSKSAQQARKVTIGELKRDVANHVWALKKTKELGRILYEDIEKKNDQLTLYNQLKNQFVANVSHEFKTPLAIIKESVALVLDGVAGEISSKQREVLESGRKNLDRLIRLVNDLLDLSKIESGKIEIKREQVNLAELMKETARICRPDIARKRIRLIENFSKDPGEIWADRDKLIQVVLNIVNNAVKFTPEGGTITLESGDQGKNARFEIRDTGCGIPKESLERIFEKFERVPSAKREGTGLGLSIAREIVNLHKGRLWAESEEGKGSAFICLLPKDLRA